MSDSRQRTAVVERAARAGGAVAQDAFRGPLTVDTKANKNDLVTNGDLETQRQVVHTIADAFPDEPFVCEEEVTIRAANDAGGADSTGPAAQSTGPMIERVPDTGPCWVVDPIDGTANFARGNVLWATSVASVVDGETVAAATYLPAVQDIYTAGPESATRNGQRLAVSDRTDPETFAVGLVAAWPSERSGRLGALVQAVNERFGDSRRYGTLQATLGFVASGELEAAVTTEPTTPWDTIAGVELVRSAGGTVTDRHGERWTPDSDSLVASNGTAHDEIVAAVEEPN